MSDGGRKNALRRRQGEKCVIGAYKRRREGEKRGGMRKKEIRRKKEAEKCRQPDGSSDVVKLLRIDLTRAQFNTHTCLSSFT